MNIIKSQNNNESNETNNYYLQYSFYWFDRDNWINTLGIRKKIGSYSVNF